MHHEAQSQHYHIHNFSYNCRVHLVLFFSHNSPRFCNFPRIPSVWAATRRVSRSSSNCVTHSRWWWLLVVNILGGCISVRLWSTEFLCVWIHTHEKYSLHVLQTALCYFQRTIVFYVSIRMKAFRQRQMPLFHFQTTPPVLMNCCDRNVDVLIWEQKSAFFSLSV